MGYRQDKGSWKNKHCKEEEKKQIYRLAVTEIWDRQDNIGRMTIKRNQIRMNS